MSAQLPGTSVPLSIQFESFVKEGDCDPYKENNQGIHQNAGKKSQKESQSQEQNADTHHESCLDRAQLSAVCEGGADGITDRNGSCRRTPSTSAAPS